MSDSRGDADLTALARLGNKDAFGELAVRHQTMAERIALRIGAAPDMARELAQEAMIQAYVLLGRLRDDERFQSWLFGIVLNVCRSYLRTRRISHLSIEALPE